MKVWEETWTAKGRTLRGPYRGPEWILEYQFETSFDTFCDKKAAKRAKLAAQAPAMARLLLRLQAYQRADGDETLTDIWNDAAELLAAAGVSDE